MIPPLIQRTVDVPGGRVWTGTYGEGPNTPLLVLHGGPGMPSYYLEPLAGLASSREVVFFDQLGCGRSEQPDDDSLWTVDRAVAEVEAVRHGLGLSRMHVLGHSWGGFLALAYARRHGQHLKSLVLSSPLVATRGWIEDAQELLQRLPDEVRTTILDHERRRDFDSPAYAQATDEFYRRFFCILDPWPPGLVRTMRELAQGPYRVMWGPSEFSQTGNLGGADLTSVLPGLNTPSLWIGGDRDEVAPGRLAGFAERASGQVKIFEEGSHCLHLEQTDRYLRLVGDFLAKADGR